MIVVDTHVLLWWALDPENLSIEAQQRVEENHTDPADRVIVATALMRGVPLLTKDSTIHAFPGVQSVW